MPIEISNQVRIQQYEDFWYTVEDTSYICMNEEQALAIADTIYKLLKKN